MTKAEIVAEMLGIKSTEVQVVTSEEGQIINILAPISEEQQATLDYFLETGFVLGGWTYPHRLRIVVPFALIEAKKDLLIYKLWCEHSGLPVENMGDTYHMYCNEILTDDMEMLKELQPLGLGVEAKDEVAQEYLNSMGV